MSAAGVEVLGVPEWITSLLSGDADLAALFAALGDPAITGVQVWEDSPPQGAPFPYIVHSHVGGADYGPLDSEQTWWEGDFDVKVVDGVPHYGRIKPIYARVHHLLQGGQGATTSDTYVYYADRMSTIKYAVTLEGNVHERHLGGRYTVAAQDRADVA